jgi:hypothetical protein
MPASTMTTRRRRRSSFARSGTPSPSSVVPRVRHLVQVAAGTEPMHALVDRFDAEHLDTIPPAVPNPSPTGRHGTLVLVCLSSMPVPLRDVGVETGVAGDSFPDAGKGWMFKGSRADRWAQLLRQRQRGFAAVSGRSFGLAGVEMEQQLASRPDAFDQPNPSGRARNYRLPYSPRLHAVTGAAYLAPRARPRPGGGDEGRPPDRPARITGSQTTWST